jgi:hypothetical protein
LCLIASTYNTFLTGQSLWTKVDQSISLDDNLRKAFDRIVPELSTSGHDKRGFFQVAISNNGGANGSDVLRFSIPVICEANGNPIDPQGDTAHWGAPVTWGCAQASCMDEDNNCETVEYKYIEYLLDDKNTLLRRVLDYSQSQVREDVIASNIANFQAEANFNQRMVTLTLTAQNDPASRLKRTATSEMNVYLRNSR